MRKPRKFKMRLGIYMPGAFAAIMAKSHENGEPKKCVIARLFEMQGVLTMTCPSSNITYPAEPFTKDDALRLYRSMLRNSYRKFLADVRRTYVEYVFVCPDCGLEGRLQENLP